MVERIIQQVMGASGKKKVKKVVADSYTTMVMKPTFVYKPLPKIRLNCKNC